jgi:LmbE family N-acetylglucosaminyl deacetylase
MNILVFFAHPDDETMLCGGLLAILSKSGHDVQFLSCTRGEGGECGVPPLCTQAQLGSLRELELACAVEELGGKSLQFLDYVDPLVGPDNSLFSFTQDQEKLEIELKDYLQTNDIDLLITHGSNGEYGHPGHMTVYQVALKIIQSEFPEMPWYTVQAYYDNSPKPHILNKADQADWIIDVSSVINEKIHAAFCHKSQHDLFVRRKSKELGKSVSVSEVIQTEESYHFANGTKDVLKNLPEIQKNLINRR